MRYCPPYAAGRKAGRPKNDKQLKSSLEGKSKRKRGEVNKGKTGGKRRSTDKGMFFLLGLKIECVGLG